MLPQTCPLWQFEAATIAFGACAVLTMLSTTRRSSTFRRFVSETTGSLTSIVAMTCLTIVILTGGAVEVLSALGARSELRQAADAAALAGARARDNNELTAQQFFNVNLDQSTIDAAGVELDLTWDAADRSMQVAATTQVNTILLGLAGIDRIELTAFSEARSDVRPLELSLVLDVTGSMSGTKIAALRSSASSMIDILYDSPQAQDNVRTAIVPFAERVNLGPYAVRLTKPDGRFMGCSEPRGGPARLNDAPPAIGTLPANTRPCPNIRIQPLTNNPAQLRRHINSLTTGGWTRVDHAAAWGFRSISPLWQGVWGPNGAPADYDPNLLKAAVLMTDGINQDANAPNGSFAYDWDLVSVCNAMKAEGIVVYAITFQAPPAADAVMRNCASGDAEFFRSPTPAELERALTEIANELTALRLSR